MRTRFFVSLAAALAATLGCAGGAAPPAGSGVQANVGKVFLRRGNDLNVDVRAFLEGRYLLFDVAHIPAESFAAAVPEARKIGKDRGASLVVLYENLDTERIASVRVPLTLPQARVRYAASEVLTRLRPGGVNALLWGQPEVASSFGAYVYDEVRSTPGVLIGFLVRGSPALLAGLQPGDRVVAVEGEPVGGDPQRFLDQVAAHRDQRPAFTYVRDGDTRETRVDVGF